MTLAKHHIGDFVELHNVACNIPHLTPDEVSGVGRDKEFFEPSRQVGSDTTKYKVVPPQYFACNLMHVGRDVVLPIALNHTDHDKYVSPAYSIFFITDESIVLKEYFLMMMVSEERDRYFWFHTDSSVRDGLSWDEFCALEIELPDISTQQKYVDVYKAMVANQKGYEKGLSDLKLTCDAYINNLDNKQMYPIKNYIERNTEKNQAGIFSKSQVKGFDNEGNFIKPMRLFSGEVETFKIIKTGCFVYNSRVNSTIKKLSIAFNEGDDLIVTPAYESFFVSKPEELHPYYLYMLLQRESFARKVLFNSFGSATLFFDIYALGELKIPVPDINVQKSIANIYRVYKTRQAINERLKAQIKDLCPILIRGSLQEGGKTE